MQSSIRTCMGYAEQTSTIASNSKQCLLRLCQQLTMMAQYSGFPQASWFQISTMAMHLNARQHVNADGRPHKAD